MEPLIHLERSVDNLHTLIAQTVHQTDRLNDSMAASESEYRKTLVACYALSAVVALASVVAFFA